MTGTEPLRATESCSCCASIVGRDPGPGEFRWHDPRGYSWPLCGECIGWWLLHALEDDILMPARISRGDV